MKWKKSTVQDVVQKDIGFIESLPTSGMNV